MKLSVLSLDQGRDLQVQPGGRLLDYLRSAEISVNAACGGRGSCHKCRVRVEGGFAAVSSLDRKAFNESELADGWRLSCQLTVRTPLALRIPQTESLTRKPRVLKHDIALNDPTWACDLGSTGLVLAIGESPKRIGLEAHLLNRQVQYGADVMTRLEAAQRLGVGALQKVLLDSVQALLTAVKESVAPELWSRLRQQDLFCAGNSAMSSFLCGWDIASLAVSPFQPARRDSDQVQLDSGVRLRSMPLMGGFVGGDTFAALAYLQTCATPESWMLIDIGTNTEIVLKTAAGELWFASAPAGPAFEGGNIHHGMRAEPGAIAHAKWQDGWKLSTIGDDQARGICGSGLIDVLFEAVRAGLIERDGFVPDGKLQLNESVFLLADDVREFQLAKSATRTACDLLCDRAGARPQKIYLAGTFAEHLHLESVHGVGLLPQDISCEKVGNAALKGALLFAKMSETERKLFAEMVERSRKPVELALQDDFQDLFVRNLNFA